MNARKTHDGFHAKKQFWANLLVFHGIRFQRQLKQHSQFRIGR
jgi:hypothetical protein